MEHQEPEGFSSTKMRIQDRAKKGTDAFWLG